VEPSKDIVDKIDSKGRLYLPPSIRKQLGNKPALKKTPEGYLIISSKQEEFRKMITSKHCRTSKPKCPSPKEMKSMFESVKN
jgi:bifunctional DNA-binding transcriptional regulator/antitoxin component of YhaV-PrlF toxin-antitoxin module